jgi:hypothetical protein
VVVVVIVDAGADVLFLKGQESGVRDAVMFLGQSSGRCDWVLHWRAVMGRECGYSLRFTFGESHNARPYTLGLER